MGTHSLTYLCSFKCYMRRKVYHYESPIHKKKTAAQTVDGYRNKGQFMVKENKVISNNINYIGSFTGMISHHTFHHPFKVIASTLQSTDRSTEPRGTPLVISPTESLLLVFASYLCTFWAPCLVYCSLTSFMEESSQTSFGNRSHCFWKSF